MNSVLQILPLLTFIGFGYVLSRIDIREHRLPNRLVLQATVSVAVCEVIASSAAHPSSDLRTVSVTTGKTFLVYVLLYLLSRGQFGLGDVKYSIVVGLIAGWYFPDQWLLAIALAFGAAALVSIGLLIGRRMNRNSRIPFGPYMTAATIVMALISR